MEMIRSNKFSLFQEPLETSGTEIAERRKNRAEEEEKTNHYYNIINENGQNNK